MLIATAGVLRARGMVEPGDSVVHRGHPARRVCDFARTPKRKACLLRRGPADLHSLISTSASPRVHMASPPARVQARVQVNHL